MLLRVRFVTYDFVFYSWLVPEKICVLLVSENEFNSFYTRVHVSDLGGTWPLCSIALALILKVKYVNDLRCQVKTFVGFQSRGLLNMLRCLSICTMDGLYHITVLSLLITLWRYIISWHGDTAYRSENIIKWFCLTSVCLIFLISKMGIIIIPTL